MISRTDRSCAKAAEHAKTVSIASIRILIGIAPVDLENRRKAQG
jgi:hypothetical protein